MHSRPFLRLMVSSYSKPSTALTNSGHGTKLIVLVSDNLTRLAPDRRVALPNCAVVEIYAPYLRPVSSPSMATTKAGFDAAQTLLLLLYTRPSLTTSPLAAVLLLPTTERALLPALWNGRRAKTSNPKLACGHHLAGMPRAVHGFE